MSWTLLSDIEEIAETRGICFLCGLDIKKGCRHSVRRGIVNGKDTMFRMHLGCMLTKQNWYPADWECGADCIAFGQELRDYVDAEARDRAKVKSDLLDLNVILKVEALREQLQLGQHENR